MKQVLLRSLKDPVAKALCAELEQLDGKPRVLQTYLIYTVGEDNCWATFSTTSKEVHLALGCLSRDGLRNLCLLLKQEFQKDLDKQILLRLGENKESTLFVSMFEEREGMLFHISPAR